MIPISLRFVRLALVATGLALLAGCDTFGIGFGPASPTVPTGRDIDYASDDLASLVFAVDVPTSLRPLPNKTVATLDASGPKGSKQIKATLVLTDGEAIGGLLPPPASGRTYFFLGFAAKDKTALVALQKWLKSLPVGSAPVTALDVSPRLCETAPLDPAATTFSVLPALPGTRLTPLVSQDPIASIAASTGGQLPPCGSV
ncbi:MAG: hypothetical protein P4M09_07085 [Devosia sp.]|nr:hypothetical protein [Devosia sp.]